MDSSKFHRLHSSSTISTPKTCHSSLLSSALQSGQSTPRLSILSQPPTQKQIHSSPSFPNLDILSPPPFSRSAQLNSINSLRDSLYPRPSLPQGFISLNPSSSSSPSPSKKSPVKKLKIYFSNPDRVHKTFSRILWTIDFLVEESFRTRAEIEKLGNWWEDGEDDDDGFDSDDDQGFPKHRNSKQDLIVRAPPLSSLSPSGMKPYSLNFSNLSSL
jgi:hypothetical protein